MLLGSYDEREYWLGQIDRIIMLKCMFDRGYELPTYQFSDGSTDDTGAEDLMIECLEIVLPQFGIALLDDNHNNNTTYYFKAVFPFRQRYSKQDRKRLEEIKEKLIAFPDSGMQEIGLSGSWQCHPDTPWIENVFTVEYEYFQAMGACLGYILDALQLFKPYLLKAPYKKRSRAS